MPITNEQILNHRYLPEMYDDGYFPDFLVDKCRAVFVTLCEAIEATKPDVEALLKLTTVATEALNKLQQEFEENESEIETVARESLCGECDFILKAYGYDVDVEDAMIEREW